MKLEDLRRGMKCELRNGDIFIFDYVADDEMQFIGADSDGSHGMGVVKHNLTNGFSEKFDIMKVYDIKDYTGKYELIWEREEAKEMTIDEVIK